MKSTVSARSGTIKTLKKRLRMTSRVRGSIHVLKGRMLPFTADDTAQNSMHCKLVPGTSLRQSTSHRTRPSDVISSSIVGQPVLRASPTSFWIQARSTRCTLNSGCLVFPFRLDVVGIIRDVLNLSSISRNVIDVFLDPSSFNKVYSEF